MNKQKMILKLNKIKFNTIKNAPKLLVGVGTIGVIGASVLACKSTLKLVGVLEKSKKTIDTIHETEKDETIKYTKEDAKKDLTITYLSTALDICALYAPSVIMGGLSITAIIKSHSILNKRNAALTAAFATTSESFAKYRKAVIDKYGERIDYELKHGIRSEKIDVTETDETGKTKKKKVSVDVVDNMDNVSEYARYFDSDTSKCWEKDPEYNLMFLKSQQQYANDKLVAQGYLFLNDVYNMVGLKESKAGQIVGWIYDPKNPEGDNFVDFGIHNTMIQGYVDDYHMETISEERRDFVNGYRPSILLDFNVDGNIWEKMGE